MGGDIVCVYVNVDPMNSKSMNIAAQGWNSIIFELIILK
jgi:hypothetical protein